MRYIPRQDQGCSVFLILIVLSGLTTACATTDDPSKSGFFDAITNLATGGYEKRLKEKQSEVETARSEGLSLKQDVRQVDVERKESDLELEISDARFALLRSELVELQQRLEISKIAEKLSFEEYGQLKSEIINLEKDVSAVHGDSIVSIEVKLKQLQILEERKQRLNEAVQTVTDIWLQ